ncbi:MAG: pentapeptide repeat-containing protein [Saprospiraceae bacterium]|nr:pentapeptide repeat-containing protein [Saprospiraceae bacterium]
MKGIRNLLIGVTLGTIMGWVLGFLRLPYLEKDYSFLLGFGLCLALVLFLLTLLFVWNKNAFLVRLIGKKEAKGETKGLVSIHTTIWLMVTVFIVVGGMISSVLIYRQNQIFDTHTKYQKDKIHEQIELIESIRQSNQVFMMSNILDNIEEEIKQEPKRILNDAIIARIAALNFSLKPYRYFDGDSLSVNKLSPERGQLLLALSLMNIDSVSFDKIKLSTSFNTTDLRGADLKGMDLNGIDLQGADLRGANLQGVNLKGANLYEVNLWGCNLRGANLDSAKMKRVDLRWSDLNNASLKSTILDGSNLTSANLLNANLRKASLRYADLTGVILNGVDLTDCDLLVANLTKANLTDSDLTGSLLRAAKFTESILIGAEFSNACINEDWFEKLVEWNTIGAKEIKDAYSIVDDTSGRYLNAKFCLKKNNN